MTADFNLDDFLALGTDDLSADSRTAKARETFPCGECAGSGRYQGRRTQQTKAHCFACCGKGYFLSSAADRRKAATQRAARENVRQERVRSAFAELNPGLIEWMRANTWSDFVGKLLAEIEAGKELSQRQVDALNSTRTKTEARRAEKQAARSTELGGDLLVLRALISRAIENGKTKPTYRALDLTISEAPAHGANAGALYVKSTSTGTYFGKIVGGKFVAGRDAEADVAARLVTIAADPKGEAVRYGTKIGACFCCGAKLTAPESVARGIGPICFGKWGF